MQNLKLVPLGFQQIAAADLAAAIGLTVPVGANVALIQVDTAPVRWRDDGTNPTTTVGMQIASAGSLEYWGTLSAIKLIAASGSPIANVSYYRTAG